MHGSTIDAEFWILGLPTKPERLNFWVALK